VTERSERTVEEADISWSTGVVMTKQQKTTLNMAKFIQAQSLLLLEKLNELDLDTEADLCEKLHEDAERLFRTLAIRLDDFQEDL
jgi:ABC-type enterochelin transport system ATPase subunit